MPDAETSSDPTAVVGIPVSSSGAQGAADPVSGTVALMEAAAVAALAGVLSAEDTSVGSHIAVDHLAPSPVGAEVTARATVSAVDGRRVTFDVAAEMDGDLVARGNHVRIVVPRSRFPA